MLFWILVIITVVLTLTCVFFADKGSDRIWAGSDDIMAIVAGTVAIASGVVVVIMLCSIISNNVNAGGERASLEEQYKSLRYKVESDSCRDEFGIINKQFVDEVQSWNMDCAKYKRLQNNFWIGIFIPNIYDDFDTINLEDFQYKNSGGQ